MFLCSISDVNFHTNPQILRQKKSWIISSVVAVHKEQNFSEGPNRQSSWIDALQILTQKDRRYSYTCNINETYITPIKIYSEHEASTQKKPILIMQWLFFSFFSVTLGYDSVRMGVTGKTFYTYESKCY